MEGRAVWCVACLAALLVLGVGAAEAEAQKPHPPRIELVGGPAIFSGGEEVVVAGSTDAPEGSAVEVRIGLPETTLPETADSGDASALPPLLGRVGPDGRFEVYGEVYGPWPEVGAGGESSPGGVYPITVTVTTPDGAVAEARQILIVQSRGRLPRRPLVTPPVTYEAAERGAAVPNPDDFQETTDRWRIAPPPYEINAVSRGWWDPYNQNKWKGDFPIHGQDLFLVLTGTSDTLTDLFTLPTPSGVSADRPSSISFFGRDEQLLVQQNVFLSADLFKGDTAFKPFDWRVKATVVGNVNYLATRENAVVKPDVRRGTTRTDGRGSVQELFGEVKLADLSPNYDFLSLRVGVQPFNSDFRGFIFTDMNLGVRLFGNYNSNRDQFNLAFFERLEKDTNSGLNTFELREQRVAVANWYRQDFLVKGYTSQWSVHYLRDEASFFFDRNGFLVRPDPLGTFTPHEIEAFYLGWTSFGHIGRWNVDSALYVVLGEDSQNPLAGRDPNLMGDDAVDIEAGMAALEISYDKNWYRPKVAFLHATGDSDPRDRTARGFDAIFENPQFAGGGFSFWNRLGIRLAQTGVALVHRGSLFPDLSSSKDEGQPNFVNPGLWLASLGLDVEVTPKLKAVATANYLRFDATEPIELPLFQQPIDKEIGLDLSVGAKWRPFLNQNVILVGGVASLVPGDGFSDIYEDSSTLFTGFLNVILTY